jgi:hypothetical protein
MTDNRFRDHALTLFSRSTTADSVEAATERRRAEFARLTQPSTELIEEARAILAAGRKARGEDDDATPRDVNGRALPRNSLAARMIAAQRKAEGKTT